MLGLLFDTENGENMFVRNVGKLLADYMASHPNLYPLHSDRYGNLKSNTNWTRLRTDCWIKYLGLRHRKQRNDGRNCMICSTGHQELLRQSNKGRWDGQAMKHVLEKEKYVQIFEWNIWRKRQLENYSCREKDNIKMEFKNGAWMCEMD